MTRIADNHNEGSAAEIVAAFYMNLFILLRPLIVSYSYRWAVLLPLIVLPLCAIALIHRRFILDGRLIKKWFILFAVITCIFLVDFVFRRNEFTWENYYAFLIHGAITGFLLLNVRRFDILLKYWVIFAIVAGILYIPDPINHYAVSGGYMNFGSGILPAFVATVIVFSFYRVKLIAPLMAVFFAETVVYANKGATVSAIAIIAFFIVFNTDDRKKRIRRILVLLIVSVILFFMLNYVFDFFSMIAMKLGVGSYALTDFRKILQIQELSSFNSRSSIWELVGKELRSHWIFGMGIGGFQSVYGNYAHNFFLDLLITHGVFLSALIIWLLIKFIKNTMGFIKYNKELFLFSFIMLLLWIFPTQFSFTYWTQGAFWIFIFVNAFYKSSYHQPSLGS